MNKLTRSQLELSQFTWPFIALDRYLSLLENSNNFFDFKSCASSFLIFLSVYTYAGGFDEGFFSLSADRKLIAVYIA